MTNEKELLVQLTEAEEDFKDAKMLLDKTKRQLVDAETNFIQKKLALKAIKEQLRVHRNAYPIHETTGRDMDIKRFRDLYPELCEEASQRDKDRE